MCIMKPIIKEDDIVVLPGDEFDQAQDQMNRKTNLVTVILFSIFHIEWICVVKKTVEFEVVVIFYKVW